MPPRRRRSKLVSAASELQDGSTAPVAAAAAMDQSIQQMLKSPCLDDTRFPAFDLDDFPEWWQATGSSDQQGTCFDMVDPLLHFPEEDAHPNPPAMQAMSSVPCLSSPTSQLLPSAPSSAPAAAAAGSGSKRSKRRTSAAAAAIGIDKKSKAISPRESHILSERQRRKGMNHLFSTLASLLPENCAKSDKSTIVSEIISYIHLLRKDLEDLDKRRSEVLRSCPGAIDQLAGKSASRSQSVSTNGATSDPKSIGTTAGAAAAVATQSTFSPQPSSPSPNVILSACGSDMFVTLVSCSKNRNVLSKVLLLMDQHKLRVLDANISTNASATFHYFHVKSLSPQLPKDSLQRDLQSLTAAQETLSPS